MTKSRAAAPRRTARRRALELLYQGDLLGRGATLGPAADDYTRHLVESVTAHRRELDALVTAHAEGWTVDRMPVVDRNVLRIAVWEALYEEAVPVAVAISEAVELAKDLSTEQSGRFVNGVLGAIVKNTGESPRAPTADAAPPAAPGDAPPA